MSSAFEVVPEDLTAHASHLDGLSDRLTTAADAARTVSMSDSAYGLICQFVPPFVNPMEQKAMEAIDAAAEGVRTSAGNIRSTATSYTDTDTAHATVYGKTLEAPARAPRPTRQNLTGD
ncbi:type VII secretion target [Actinophytocola xanthii]|uniref:ESX-1 secretion-associated protein n=1 Tax=Actinophytocola xanthii TaxID=1912961 RepID=A0A1Q8CVZ9_9PSEU|nr:type VII secretion target [Actinophytocola xanthii]OLF18531.1 ESX-1 secretion-associated protein [Actinophytocola xanthii]